jgi:hypothetical protein
LIKLEVVVTTVTSKLSYFEIPAIVLENILILVKDEEGLVDEGLITLSTENLN